jgi:OOP family OmpA-OmpF porin
MAQQPPSAQSAEDGAAAATYDLAPLPPGAVETWAQTRDPGQWPAPLRRFGDDGPVTETVEGRLTVRTFRIDGDAATLATARWAQDRFEAQGYATILDCGGADCGGFDFRQALRTAPAPHMRISLGDFRQLTMRRGDDLAALTLSRAGGALWGQLATVADAYRPAPETTARDLPEKPSDAAPSGPDAGAPAPLAPGPETIGAALDLHGHAPLDGVAFRANSTELAEGGAAMLDAAAAAIAERPDRAFLVVGHTDDAGPLDVNIRVGRERAEAVRRALVDRGVQAERLTAEGAGWLAPRASNATEAGRALNRRVELIVR